jgi:hypothetical protein
VIVTPTRDSVIPDEWFTLGCEQEAATHEQDGIAEPEFKGPLVRNNIRLEASWRIVTLTVWSGSLVMDLRALSV